MSRFRVGQIVISLVDAQGLVRQREYRIVDLRTRPTAFGTFVTYWLRDARSEGNPRPVINGHLVLKEAGR